MSSLSSTSSLSYRADIDGLRAVAVLGVILYHAFPNSLPGGFSGVDIFFVISGYLISGILYKGVTQGTFRFADFYARRVRRLFPSLIVLLVLCLGYGRVLLLPDEFREVGRQVAAGTLFLQNFVFWSQSGYFDVSSDLKPLLHLWSLAVEEQFYLIFPPLMILLWKRRWPFAPVIGLLLAGSLVLNLVMSCQDPVPDFFLTPYRSWEFLGGALLAWHHFERGHAGKSHGVWMAPLGFGLLAGSMILLHSGQPYPGWRAMFPVTGTLLLIGAGSHAWFNRTILSHRIAVAIGLVSYPLYLFHWPLLSFLRIVKGAHPPWTYTVIALMIALALTLATYFLVERPLRRSRSRYVVASLVGVFAASGFVGLCIWKGIIPARPIPEAFAKIRSALADNDIMEGLPHSGAVWLNHLGGNGPQTLVVGDSNAQMYIARLRKLTGSNPPEGRGVQMVTAGGVPPIPGITNLLKKNCPDLIPSYRRVLRNDPRIDRIVIASLWSQYTIPSYHYLHNGEPLSRPDVRDAALADLTAMIRDAIGLGKHVTLVLDLPFGVDFDPKGLLGRDFAGVPHLGAKEPSRAEYLGRYGDFRARLAAAARAGGADVIDPLDAVCTGDRCLIMDGEGPIRFDQGHLRPGFVREKAIWIDSAVLAPEESAKR